MRKEVHQCCICGKEFEGFGNNPDGAVWLDPKTKQPVFANFTLDERCCDECNSQFVIPGRIYRMQHGEN